MLLGLWGPQAMSLSLGRVVVQSALGEPLRADIDFLELSPEEASTLSTAIASPEAFRLALDRSRREGRPSAVFLINRAGGVRFVALPLG